MPLVYGGNNLYSQVDRSYMSFVQDKFNELVFALLRQISPRLGLKVIESDPDKLRLEADASIPARGIGRYIVLLSLLPFYSDLLVEPGDLSPLNGYDFYNHLGAIPLRLGLTLPGLWILLIYGKVTRCEFDKSSNTFLVEQKSYLVNQRSEGSLQEISALEISPVERPSWRLFGGDIFTHIQVSLLRNSGEPVSFIFIEHKSEIDSATQQVRNMLTEFLSLPS